MSEIQRTSPNSARANVTYEHEPGAVLDAVERALERLSNWRVVSRYGNFNSGISGIGAVRSTSVLRFKDEIIVEIRPVDEPGRSILELTSYSRLGKSDFGQNPRNLRELLDALDQELSTRG